MKPLIRVFTEKIMYTKLYTPNRTFWTLHSKYKSRNDAVNTLKLFPNGHYRHVLLLTVKDDGKVWHAINVVDNKQGTM